MSSQQQQLQLQGQGHSFHNCPLRSSSLLITNHATQAIVTATDEVLDLLGYSMSELSSHSIQSLHLQLQARFTAIPECTIQHANGEILDFQVCIHQDPLGATTCLDYWLIRRRHQLTPADTSLPLPSLSVLCLSPYGTIEQVQPSIHLNQPLSELIGRPVMGFIYQDDVESLCASLSKICSLHSTTNKSNTNTPQAPLLIRWSRLPYLITPPNHDDSNSLNYDWMSFTLSSTPRVATAAAAVATKPICILRSLTIEDPVPTSKEEEEDAAMVIHVSLFSQFLDYFKFLYNHLMQAIEESTESSKIYMAEFYQHVMSSLVEILTMYLHSSSNNGSHNNGTITQQQVPVTTATTTEKPKGYLWDLFKSNYILQRSLDILEFTGLLDQPHFKTYMETVVAN